MGDVYYGSFRDACGYWLYNIYLPGLCWTAFCGADYRAKARETWRNHSIKCFYLNYLAPFTDIVVSVLYATGSKGVDYE